MFHSEVQHNKTVAARDVWRIVERAGDRAIVSGAVPGVTVAGNNDVAHSVAYRLELAGTTAPVAAALARAYRFDVKLALISAVDACQREWIAVGHHLCAGTGREPLVTILHYPLRSTAAVVPANLDGIGCCTLLVGI